MFELKVVILKSNSENYYPVLSREKVSHKVRPISDKLRLTLSLGHASRETISDFRAKITEIQMFH